MQKFRLGIPKAGVVSAFSQGLAERGDAASKASRRSGELKIAILDVMGESPKGRQ